MTGGSLTGLTRRRLRVWLAAFFLALAVPGAVLVYQAYDQLKWESFHRSRQLAEDLAVRIDAEAATLIAREETRAFADYGFLVLAGDPNARFLQRSALSAFPVAGALPGLIGYFQIDADGRFSSPLLPRDDVSPAAYGVTASEQRQRARLEASISAVLLENRLIAAERAGPIDRPSTAAGHEASARSSKLKWDRRRADETQLAFDQLARQSRGSQPPQVSPNALGRVEDLELSSRYEQRSLADDSAPVRQKLAERKSTRATRKENVALPTQRKAEALESQTPALSITTFESELDPFEFSLLGSGHFVLYRKVWRDGKRYIQGAVIEQAEFVRSIVETRFRGSLLPASTRLAFAYGGNVLQAFGAPVSDRYLSSADELRGALLYRTRLSAPLADFELLFTVTHLPAGPGATLISWLAGVLFIVLCAGFALTYRAAARQIELTTQQQDFVAAVSHELKTPLTSIRMYGEMLQAGWATEASKQQYYSYILSESERLTRLISNVLQLARMTRNDLAVQLSDVPVVELVSVVRERTASQLLAGGFELELKIDDAAAPKAVRVDTDFFTQIVINLIDNAVKFSAAAGARRIEFGAELRRDREVEFFVRDFGPGIAGDQMRKIFGLFYRAENELTRETVGTGIGLALVHQLAHAMGASVDVANAQPGARFSLRVQTVDSDSPGTR